MSDVWYDAYRKLPKPTPAPSPFNKLTFGLVAITTFIVVISIGTTVSVVVRSLLPIDSCDPPAQLKQLTF